MNRIQTSSIRNPRLRAGLYRAGLYRAGLYRAGLYRAGLYRAGLWAGLLDGVWITVYDVGLGDRLATAVLVAACCAALIASLQVAVWMLLGLLVRRLDPIAGFRAVFSIWILIAVGANRLLSDRSSTYALAALLALVVLLWTVRLTFWERFSATARQALAGAGIFWVGLHGLLGKVPDYHFDAGAKLAFYALGALLALVLWLGLTRRPATTLTTVFLAAGTWAVFVLAVPVADKPNVLWILIDTLRRDHLSPFGSEVATPAVERLASQGARFDQAVTVVPKTPASVASFFTGRYPVHHGLRALHDDLRRSEDTVAELLGGAGYLTSAFVHNPWLGRGQGFQQGFHSYRGYYELNRPYGVLRYVSWVVVLDRLSFKKIPAFAPQTSSRLLTERVTAFLKRRSRRPFFAYVHYFEPHWPYLPPAELAVRHGGPEDGACLVNFFTLTGRSRGEMIFKNPLPPAENEKGRRLYRAEVDHTARQVGRLLAALSSAGLDEKTLVVLTADHGHSLGQHGYFFHHGSFLYDDSVRIPLVMRWPGKIPAGLVVDAQVRSIDLMPTLLRLAGLPLPADLDGRPLLRYWRGGEPEPPRRALLESDVKMFKENGRRPLRGVSGKLRGVRAGRHKLVMTPREEGPAFELFDLLLDPAEKHNVIAAPEYLEVGRELVEWLNAQLPPQELAAADIERLSPRDRELLESLGYI